LLGATVIAIALACRLGLKGFIGTIGLLIVLEGVSSALLVFYNPDLGVMGGGEWQGIFAHKNELGLAMVLGMVTVACLGDEWRGIRRGLRIAALVAMMVLIVGSRSATSLSVALTFALIFPLGLWSRSRNDVRPALFGGLLLSVPVTAALLTGVGANRLLSVFGRDTSLSGRADLWQVLIADIGQRPALGYGYGVYWSPNGPAAHYLLRIIHWNPGMAHNGFLEVALNTGLVGVGVLILLLVVGVTRAWAQFWEGRDRASAWPFYAIVYVILSNFSEASFERRHNIHWVVFVAAFLFATDYCLRRARSKAPEKVRLQPVQLPSNATQ
jgi:O-antigen ligase